MVTFAFPYALAAIGWKTYMINGAWDVLEIAFLIYFWVETKGKTLEEIDEVCNDDLIMIVSEADDASSLMVLSTATSLIWKLS